MKTLNQRFDDLIESIEGELGRKLDKEEFSVILKSYCQGVSDANNSIENISNKFQETYKALKK